MISGEREGPVCSLVSRNVMRPVGMLTVFFSSYLWSHGFRRAVSEELDLARVLRLCQIRLGSKKTDSEMEICVQEVS